MLALRGWGRVIKIGAGRWGNKAFAVMWPSKARANPIST